MKKLFLSIALLGGLMLAHAQTNTNPTPAKGQGQGMKNATPQDRSMHEANMAEKKLGLNADQKAKWQAAALERINANELIHEKLNGSTTPEERKTLYQQAKANKDKFDANVSGFLTSEQKTKFDQMKTQRKEKRMERRGRGPGGPRR